MKSPPTPARWALLMEGLNTGYSLSEEQDAGHEAPCFKSIQPGANGEWSGSWLVSLEAQWCKGHWTGNLELPRFPSEITGRMGSLVGSAWAVSDPKGAICC